MFISSPLFFIFEWHLFIGLSQNLFVPLLVDGHLALVQLWAITSKAASHIVYKSFCGYMLSFFLAEYLGVEWQGDCVGLYF